MHDDQRDQEDHGADDDLSHCHESAHLLSHLLGEFLVVLHEIEDGRTRDQPRRDRQQLARQAPIHGEQGREQRNGDQREIDDGKRPEHSLAFPVFSLSDTSTDGSH